MSKTLDVLVGASRGVGRAVAEAWHGAGRSVAVLARKEPPPAQRLDGVKYRAVDASDRAEADKVLSGLVSKHGKLGTLVFFQRFRGEGDDWAGELATTLTTTKNLIEAAAGSFDEAGPRSIVVVGSLVGRLVALDASPAYHVAKAGLLQLARYYAVSLAPKGLRVNCVSPGLVLKPEAKEFYAKNPKLVETFNKATPLGRMASPDDVRHALDYLCGPGASFVTGHELVVDGGLSLQWQATLAKNLCA